MPEFPAPTHVRTFGRRRVAGNVVRTAAGLLTAGVALAACTASSGTHQSAGSSPPPTSDSPSGSPTTSSAPATLTVDIRSDHSVNPAAPISIKVANGTLTKVTMVNKSGKHVTGATSSDGHSWHTTEVLGYGKTYSLTAIATGSQGPITKHEKITTLEPSSTNTVTMDRMGGYALDGHETYGVALIPVVHFSSPVHHEAAAQKALQVHTSRPVAGVWSWVDNQDVAYRPKTFWPAHTQVTVAANVYGVKLAKGEYGASDEQVSYTVGRKKLTVADDNAPEGVDKVRVYDAAGKVLRTMDTSMGQHTGVTVNGSYINFYTLNGTYTVLEHDNPAIMSSTSYGLPVSDGGYKAFPVPYSTKISVDGIYLHEYNSTEYDQTHGIDASEGCLNLVTADAVWYFDHTLIGDPVIVHGKKAAPEIQPWQGGYWSVPWSKWQAGSALS